MEGLVDDYESGRVQGISWEDVKQSLMDKNN